MLLGYRQMHGGGGAYAAFQHAAHHAWCILAGTEVGDGDGLAEAAGFHQLDVDDVRRAEGELQKITDGFVAEIDSAVKGKEAEIMEV